MCGVHPARGWEFCYWLGRPFWGCGYASEAALACRDYAFETLKKPRVISLVRPENEPSQGVAKKLGMEVIGRAPHSGSEHLIFAVNNPQVSGLKSQET